MATSTPESFGTPRFVSHRALTIAGFRGRYGSSDLSGIPGLWQRFRPHVGSLTDALRGTCYGVSYDPDEAGNFDYLAGTEVADLSDVPAELDYVRIAARRYAVFAHRDHISAIGRTFSAIWNAWLPASGLAAANAPNFERYDARFDPCTGEGGLEIWIPLAD